jgi:hypothetical protein
VRERVPSNGRLENPALQTADAGAGARRDVRGRPHKVARAPHGRERECSELRGAVGWPSSVSLGQHDRILDSDVLEKGEHLKVAELEADLRIQQHEHQLERLPLAQVLCRELSPAFDGGVFGEGEAVAGHIHGEERTLALAKLEEVERLRAPRLVGHACERRHARDGIEQR